MNKDKKATRCNYCSRVGQLSDHETWCPARRAAERQRADVKAGLPDRDMILVKPTKLTRASRRLSLHASRLHQVSSTLYEALGILAMGMDRLSRDTATIAEERVHAIMRRANHVPLPGLEHY